MGANEEKIFHLAFRRYGPLWLPSDADPGNKSIAARGMQMYRALAPDVYTGYVANDTFNAAATLRDNRDRIGIFVGSGETLHRFFLTLLANPNCLEDIGNATCEVIQDAPLDLLNPKAAEPREHFPMDAIRLHAARDLAFCSSLILFCHELAHVRLCHVPFEIRYCRHSEYLEMRSGQMTEEEALLSQTLEWDADSTSAHTSLSIWQYVYENLPIASLGPIGWLRSWTIATSMLFWIMALMEAKRDIRRRSHPLPLIRLVLSLNTVFEMKNIQAPSDTEMRRDNLTPWIETQFPARYNQCTLPDASSIAAELEAYAKQYVHIADRLEKLQDARSVRTGQALDRLEYPGRGWASKFRARFEKG